MTEFEDVFGEEESLCNDWKEHYVYMPEYDNVRKDQPLITVTFKFNSRESFEYFNEFVKENLYDGKRVFDGMQRKHSKSAWFPPNEKDSNYRYL